MKKKKNDKIEANEEVKEKKINKKQKKKEIKEQIKEQKKNKKENLSKNEKREESKLSQKLRTYIALGINVLLGISTTYLVTLIYSFKNIENVLRYFLIIILILLTILIIVLTHIHRKKNTIYIILLIINILFTFVFSIVYYNLNIVNNALIKITEQTELVEVSLVSLEKKSANTVKSEKIGIVKETVSPNINKLSKELIDSLKYDNDYVEFDDYLSLGNALMEKKISFAVMPSNYKDIYGLYTGYEDLVDKVIVITSLSKENENEETVQKSINDPFTVLLMGGDSLSPSFNADTILIVTVNPKTLTATMLSVPRDIYTQCAQGIKHKINASGWAGDWYVKKTVENYLGISIDYFARVNFKGLVELVDAVGGIDIDVPYSFCEQNSDREWGDKTIFVDKGLQHLDGEHALAVTRNRHKPFDGESTPMDYMCPDRTEGVRNDYVRGQNQQTVIKALLNKMKEIDDIQKFYDILDSLSSNMSTNMSRDTILSFYNLAKEIITQADGIDLSDAVNIKRLYLNQFGFTVHMYGLDLSCTGSYDGSKQAVVNAMKNNLKNGGGTWTKSFAFDINNPYNETLIGKSEYGGRTLPNLMDSVVGMQLDQVMEWAKTKGVEVIPNYIIEYSGVDNQVTSQSIERYVDLDTTDKKLTVNVRKIGVIEYPKCLEEENKTLSYCKLKSYKGTSVSAFKQYINQIGLGLNVDYIESETETDNDNITDQTNAGEWLYDIINNGKTITVKFNKKKIEEKKEEEDKTPDEDKNLEVNPITEKFKLKKQY